MEQHAVGGGQPPPGCLQKILPIRSGRALDSRGGRHAHEKPVGEGRRVFGEIFRPIEHPFGAECVFWIFIWRLSLIALRWANGWFVFLDGRSFCHGRGGWTPYRTLRVVMGCRFLGHRNQIRIHFFWWWRMVGGAGLQKRGSCHDRDLLGLCVSRPINE